MGPLEGIKVIDLTTIILGPLATQVFGDLGADVIKVEAPGGDPIRHISRGRHKGMAGISLNIHRNKRSIVLDLKQEKGREALLKLIETADVLIHNIRPKAVERLGLDYEKVRTINPKLVYCMATGFGSGGPYYNRAAYDDLIQGASGIAHLVGRFTGEPAFFPGILCDKITGLTAVYSVLAALLGRARTNKGQFIEVPMFETMIAFNLLEHIHDSVFVPEESDLGYQRLLNANRKPHRTKDGYVVLLPYTDQNWRDFFEIAGLGEMADDARFKDLGSRTRHIEMLYGIVNAAAKEKTTDEWVNICERHNIPCMPLLDLRDTEEDPHLAAKKFIKHVEHPSEGLYKYVDNPVSFSDTPAELNRHAPTIGEHSAEVLKEAGYSDAEIDALFDSGASAEGSRNS